jgi:hypothetical protein
LIDIGLGSLLRVWADVDHLRVCRSVPSGPAGRLRAVLVKRSVVGVVLLGLLAGCSSGKQDKASTVVTHESSNSHSAGTPSPAPPTSDSVAPSPSATPTGTTATSSPTFVPTPDVGDPCTLLPASLIASTLGVKSEDGAQNSRAQFAGCNYSLTGSSGSGQLILYLSTGRGPQIYNATQSGGGFTDVSGVGAQAAYNSEDGRFIARTDKDFVELTLPFNLKGATSDSPDGAKKAGTTLVNKVLSSIS